MVCGIIHSAHPVSSFIDCRLGRPVVKLHTCVFEPQLRVDGAIYPTRKEFLGFLRRYLKDACSAWAVSPPRAAKKSAVLHNAVELDS